MNMLTFDKKTSHDSTQFIAEHVFAVENISAEQQDEKQVKAKQLLDRLFPLEQGSHQDVTSYQIDYHHILAYFKDGTHSGLSNNQQFAAFVGEKERPTSILFRDGSGSHVELLIARHQGTGEVQLVSIDDIQLETNTMFNETSGMRHWISLVKGDEQGRPQACSEDKEYRGKCGEEYFLTYCYEL